MSTALWWLQSPWGEWAVEQQQLGVQALPGAAQSPPELRDTLRQHRSRIQSLQHPCTMAVLLNPHYTQHCPSFHHTKPTVSSSWASPGCSHCPGRKEGIISHAVTSHHAQLAPCPCCESPSPRGGRASGPGVTSQQCPCSSLPSSGTFLLQRICSAL